MRSDALVSVIIIFLDAEKFIDEAIQCVFAQTYPDWELLLVDDGSTDRSTVIARQYAAQYPRKIRYLEHTGHQNRGMSASRNLGLRCASGEYIAFLDSDDVWLPHKLERQVAILTSYPEAAMTCGPSLWGSSWMATAEEVEPDALRELGIQPNTLFRPPTLFNLFVRREARTPATCAVLMRRDMLETVGGFEEDFRGMYEDQVFFAKVYFNVAVFVSGECLDKYRQHPESHCAVADRSGSAHYEDSNPARQV